jgi:hypothetical protein
VYEKGGSTELRKAITLHPVKDPAVMRKLHVEAETIKLDALRARKIRLERELSGTPASLSRRVANTTNDLQIWDYIALNKITFCANQVTCPRHTIDSNVRAEIGNVVTQVTQQLIVLKLTFFFSFSTSSTQMRVNEDVYFNSR